MIIDLENAKEARIKRANTDWWINEKAIVADNGKTYIVYTTDMGEIHIKEFDAKNSNALSKDFCLCRLNCNYADEHNAPSLCILRDGTIIVAYTGHGVNGSLKYRITKKPYDIFSFDEEKALLYDGNATYAQLFENTLKNEVWLFTRVNKVNWQFRYSKNKGADWSEPVTFITSDAGGLFYVNIRKQLVTADSSAVERWIFALYGHPYVSKDHTIRSGIIDCEGYLCELTGERTKINIYGYDENGSCKSLFPLNDLSVVYKSPEGTTVRLLTVAPTVPIRVGLATFKYPDDKSAVYRVATFNGGEWLLSSPIADSGMFLAPGQTDGSASYVPGFEFYYGVGESGLSYHKGKINTNRIFLARKSEKYWLVESYVSENGGADYLLEQEIRKIPIERNIKIWRPTVPVFAEDNMPVYWHEGIYYGHTGAWHCDEVMLVDYDN